MMRPTAPSVPVLPSPPPPPAPRRPQYARGGPVMSGAHVIITRGLADGYEPPSASLDPPPVRTRASERARAQACGQVAPILGATPLEAATNLMAKLGRCPHGEAEDVVLTTGEVVAAVCPTCWVTLPASFVGSEWKP